MGAFPNYSDERSALEDEIKQLESAAIASSGAAGKTTLPNTRLKQLEYDAPSDADINAAAQDKLSQFRTDTVNNIKSNSEANEKELNSKRAAYAAQLDSELASLDKSYAAAAENIDNDVLRRGLGRSSIAIGQKEELENEYMKLRKGVGSDYGGKIADLDAEINSVSAKLAKALDDFNIAYAAKLNETVNELKKERAEKIEEIEKYNNDIRYKQAKLDESKAKTESKLYSDALDQQSKANSTNTLSADKQDELYKSVYDKLDAFLGSMSPEDARLEINNHSFYRQHLSGYYYYKLLDKYGR